MPKTINPAAKWTDQIDVPRAGEGVKAAGVELPFSDVLANTKQLKNLVGDLQTRVDALGGGGTGTDLSTAVAALDTRVDHLEAAATGGDSAGIATTINDLTTGLAALTARVAVLEAVNVNNPADFQFVPTYKDLQPAGLWITLLPRTILPNADYKWQITTLGLTAGTMVVNKAGQIVVIEPPYRPAEFSNISATLTITDADSKVYTMTKSFPILADI